MLNRVADLLEIKGENFFKIRAYREAVRQLDNLTTEVEDLIREGKLKDVPGIGPAIEQKITEFVTCLLYTSPSPRDLSTSRMPSSA